MWRDGNAAVYAVDIRKDTLRNLSQDPADDRSPVWSPDGEWLAFVSMRDGNANIYVVNLEYGAQYTVTEHPTEDIHPGWSPDRKRIMFLLQRAGGWGIYVIDFSSGDERAPRKDQATVVALPMCRRRRL